MKIKVSLSHPNVRVTAKHSVAVRTSGSRHREDGRTTHFQDSRQSTDTTTVEGGWDVYIV